MCRDDALAEEDELRAEGSSEGIVAREASEAETQPVSLTFVVHSRHFTKCPSTISEMVVGHYLARHTCLLSES